MRPITPEMVEEALPKVLARTIKNGANKCTGWTRGLSHEYPIVSANAIYFTGVKTERLKAGRVLWTAFRGPILLGLLVRHICDNPTCLNLAHLELGTIAENNKDRAERGTRSQQRRRDAVVLTVSDVAFLRRQGLKP